MNGFMTRKPSCSIRRLIFFFLSYFLYLVLYFASVSLFESLLILAKILISYPTFEILFPPNVNNSSLQQIANTQNMKYLYDFYTYV